MITTISKKNKEKEKGNKKWKLKIEIKKIRENLEKHERDRKIV